MEIIHIILGIIVVIICFEIVKHFFFKKTSKLFMAFLLILVLFLFFSYMFKGMESFQDNNLIQTGGVISEEIVQIFKEKVGAGQILNSTLKSNKLFKS